jgi:hypothetical protein
MRQECVPIKINDWRLEMLARKTIFALCTAAFAATAIVSVAPSADAQSEGRCFKTERDAKFYPEVRGCDNEGDRECRVVLEQGHAVRFLTDRTTWGVEWTRVRTIVGIGYVRRSSITEANEDRCHLIPRD